MGAAAEIIKIDAEILELQIKLKDKDGPELKARLEKLLEKRLQLLESMENTPRRGVE